MPLSYRMSYSLLEKVQIHLTVLMCHKARVPGIGGNVGVVLKNESNESAISVRT